jgi:hypothetical protein
MPSSKRKKGKHAQSNPALWDDEEEQVVSQEQANAERIAGALAIS